MDLNTYKLLTFAILLIILIISSCTNQTSQPYDPNTEVPTGDPAFPVLERYWVIDEAKVLSHETVIQGTNICQRLQFDGIAEVVLLVIKGVKHPNDYATHYGRWLKLGKSGPSTEGGNNGLVVLIRPDVKPEENRMTISPGRGLTRLAPVDMGELIDKKGEAKEYMNFGNFDQGVMVLLQKIDKKLRQLYPSPINKGGK